MNKDLLYTAAIFHDIGKTKELSTFPENDYTDDGQLLGHIVIGVEMIGEGVRTIEGISGETCERVETLCNCTSWRTEYGSPKKTGACRGGCIALCRCDRCEIADIDGDL